MNRARRCLTSRVRSIREGVGRAGPDGAPEQAAMALIAKRFKLSEERCEKNGTKAGLAEKCKAAAWTEAKCDKHEFVGDHI